jgi:hypothetical protein
LLSVRSLLQGKVVKNPWKTYGRTLSIPLAIDATPHDVVYVRPEVPRELALEGGVETRGSRTVGSGTAWVLAVAYISVAGSVRFEILSE